MNFAIPKFLSGLTAPAPRMPEPAKPVLPERYEYGGAGKMVVRLSPVKQKALDDKLKALRVAHDRKIDDAENVRRATVRAAMDEYQAAEHALLAEYAASSIVQAAG